MIFRVAFLSLLLASTALSLSLPFGNSDKVVAELPVAKALDVQHHFYESQRIFGAAIE